MKALSRRNKNVEKVDGRNEEATEFVRVSFDEDCTRPSIVMLPPEEDATKVISSVSRRPRLPREEEEVLEVMDEDLVQGPVLAVPEVAGARRRPGRGMAIAMMSACVGFAACAVLFVHLRVHPRRVQPSVARATAVNGAPELELEGDLNDPANAEANAVLREWLLATSQDGSPPEDPDVVEVEEAPQAAPQSAPESKPSLTERLLAMLPFRLTTEEPAPAPAEPRLPGLSDVPYGPVPPPAPAAPSKPATAVASAKPAPAKAPEQKPAAAPTPKIKMASGSSASQLLWPVSSMVITSRFGERIDPVNPTVSKVHRGVDVRCDEGTPVLAAGSGEVISAQRSKRGGLTVRLSHDGGVFTLYAHLKEASVAPGDLVEGGQQIGLSGSSGRVTGPHLHFELWKKGQARDPLAYRWRQPADQVAQGEALTGALATVTGPGR